MFNKLFLATTTSWTLASLLILPLFYLLYLLYKKRLKLSVEQGFVFIFLVLFWISFGFRLQPYGFFEFVGFSLGPIFYLVIKHFEFKGIVSRQQERVSWVTTIIVSLLSLHGILDFIVSQATRLHGVFQGAFDYEISPNKFAALLTIIIPLNCYLVYREKGKKVGLAASLLALNLTAFILTFSRGAYLGLLVASSVATAVALIHFLRHKLVGVFPLGRSLVLVGVIMVSILASIGVNELHRLNQPADLAAEVPLTEDFTDRLTDKGLTADQATDERLQYWQGSSTLIKLHPLFGIGSNGFSQQYPRVQKELLATSVHPHNFYIKLALENGIITSVFFLLFIATVFFNNLLNLFKKQNSKSDFLWSVVLLSGLLAMLVHGLVDYNLNAVLIWAGFWVLLSAQAPKLKEFQLSLHFSRLLTTVIGIFLLGVAVVVGAHILTYSQVKSLQSQFDNGEKLLPSQVLSLTNGPFSHLNYELLVETLTATDLDTAEVQSALIKLDQLTKKYPYWATSYVGIGRAHFILANPQLAATAYNQALTYNNTNDFQWHYEFVNTIATYDLPTLVKLEDVYLNLLTSYLLKLDNNASNTVATKNPAAARATIDLFLKHSNKVEWQLLAQDYDLIWQDEAGKFEKLFNMEL